MGDVVGVFWWSFPAVEGGGGAAGCVWSWVGRRCGEYGRRDGGDARDRHFACQCGVPKDLAGGVEVAAGVGGDDHDGFLGLRAMMSDCGGWSGVEGVGEEELGEFALAEGDEGGFRGGRGWVGGVGVVLLAVVGLHLHALAEIHEGFVDFSGFGECCACGLGCAGALGT